MMSTEFGDPSYCAEWYTYRHVEDIAICMLHCIGISSYYYYYKCLFYYDHCTLYRRRLWTWLVKYLCI